MPQSQQTGDATLAHRQQQEGYPGAVLAYVGSALKGSCACAVVQLLAT